MKNIIKSFIITILLSILVLIIFYIIANFPYIVLLFITITFFICLWKLVYDRIFINEVIKNLRKERNNG